MPAQISVVIPLYNKQDEIARCLRSVLAQTFGDFEVVVIDDGSTDASADRAVTFTDPRIRIIHQVNGGLAAARNRGAAEARTEKIAYLDADDTWLPEHLAQVMRLFEKVPEAGLVLTAYWIDRGGGMRRRVRLPRQYISRDAQVRDYFALPNGKTLPSASAVSRRAQMEVGGFRQMFGEDIDFFLRVAAIGTVAYGREATAVWHVDAQNRMCVTEQSAVKLYEPALQASLDFLAGSPAVAARSLQRARRSVARREREAVLNTLLTGQRAHARGLLARWKKEFGDRDPILELLIEHAPLGLLRQWARLRDRARKVATAAAYALEWPANWRAFGGRAG